MLWVQLRPIPVPVLSTFLASCNVVLIFLILLPQWHTTNSDYLLIKKEARCAIARVQHIKTPANNVGFRIFPNSPYEAGSLPDLSKIAEIHDVRTAGKVERDVNCLLASWPGRLQHHLHLHVVGVPLRPRHLHHSINNTQTIHQSVCWSADQAASSTTCTSMA